MEIQRSERWGHGGFGVEDTIGSIEIPYPVLTKPYPLVGWREYWLSDVTGCTGWPAISKRVQKHQGTLSFGWLKFPIISSKILQASHENQGTFPPQWHPLQRRRAGRDLQQWLQKQLKAHLVAWLKSQYMPTSGTKQDCTTPLKPGSVYV